MGRIRLLRFPVPLDKGNDGSGNEIVVDYLTENVSFFR